MRHFHDFYLNVLPQEVESKNLQKQVKQSEEESTRLQKTITNQQSQIDKYKKMFEEGKVKNDGLESQVTALKRVSIQIMMAVFTVFNNQIKIFISCIFNTAF